MSNPTDTNQASEDEKLAKLFHDTYERLAPAFSYKTRKASAVPWTDVPPNNKGLMIAVAHEINDAIRTEKLKLLAEVREQVVGEDVEYVKWYTDITGEQDYYYTVKRPMAVKHQNELRGKQRAELTKMEAEL